MPGGDTRFSESRVELPESELEIPVLEIPVLEILYLEITELEIPELEKCNRICTVFYETALHQQSTKVYSILCSP